MALLRKREVEDGMQAVLLMDIDRSSLYVEVVTLCSIPLKYSFMRGLRGALKYATVNLLKETSIHKSLCHVSAEWYSYSQKAQNRLMLTGFGLGEAHLR